MFLGLTLSHSVRRDEQNTFFNGLHFEQQLTLREVSMRCGVRPAVLFDQAGRERRLVKRVVVTAGVAWVTEKRIKTN